MTAENGRRRESPKQRWRKPVPVFETFAERYKVLPFIRGVLTRSSAVRFREDSSCFLTKAYDDTGKPAR